MNEVDAIRNAARTPQCLRHGRLDSVLPRNTTVLTALMGALLIVCGSTARGGNTMSQEYGDPMYRNMFPGLWPAGYWDYDHAAVFAGLDSTHSHRIIHAQLLGVLDGWRSEMACTDCGFMGAYNLNNYSPSFTDRRSIVGTAIQLRDADIGFEVNDALDYKGLSFDGSVDDINNIRCDGVVEYCYERDPPGLCVWGRYPGFPGNCDISDDRYVDEHNNMPDLWPPPWSPCEPGGSPETDSELSALAQRGGDCNTNAYLTWSALTDVPTYSASKSQVGSTVNVDITACDQSGIHYIKYKVNSGAWTQSPTQPQHPNSNCYTWYDILVTPPARVCYYAKDNGGNYPEYADCIHIEPEINCEDRGGHDFGSVRRDECSTAHTWTVRNDGNATLTGTVSLTGSHASQFEITEGAGSFSLEEDQSRTVKVRFCPTSGTNKSATLHITSNDSDEGPCDQSLNGEGSIIVESPAIEPIPDATIQAGVAYTGPTPALSQGTAPITWTLSVNPTGMTIDVGMGVVSWPDPTTSGRPHTATIEASNSAGSDTESWVLTVVDRPYHPADMMQTWDSDCTCAACEDWRIERCEAIAYAAAWKQGDHDDMAAAMRSLYLWLDGECYCWDESEDNWVPDSCE